MIIDRLRQMAIFSKTIDHGSFRGAARDLNLSPSVVSHHVSQLEEHLGVALMYRSTRRLTLTAEGQRLLGATRNMLDAVEGELADLSETARDPSGELRLTMPSVLSQSQLTQKIATFSIAHPRVNLSVDFSDARRELIADGLDLAIRMGAKVKRSPTARTLFHVQRKLVATSAYLATKPPVLSPSDLTQLDWVVLPQVHSASIVLKHSNGQTATVKPKSRLSANGAFAIFSLARAGAGIAIVPDFLTQEHLSACTLVEVLKDWKLPPVTVFAEWPANAPKHGLVHQFLRSLES
jgi:DNA-binding transcriptional LysR family regulator